ncbi:MAG: metallophosphoesterase [Candidatus Thorarchaeota archaeon]
MIIVVSDIHLGSQMANKAGFFDFIRSYLEPNQDEISRIVLLGDILDLWRNSNSQVMLQNLDVLTEIGRLDMIKNYIAGNHDYAVYSLLNQNTSQVPPDSTGVLDNVSEALEIRNDGLNLKFIHGHQIDYWPALRFYEIFSKAMCFVDVHEEELSNVWTIINQFAENLPLNSKSKLNALSHDSKIALEQKLAGPIDGKLDGEKTGLLYEWALLRKVSDFEDVSIRCGKPLEFIEDFAYVWEENLKTIDQYSDFRIPPPNMANEVHKSRRVAADLSVGLQEDQFLIRGHGHLPYINQESKVADAGCWLGTKGSYIVIDDGEVSVNQWPKS